MDQVLSDPQKRGVYDQFGEEGLKSGGNSSGFHFRPRSAEKVYAEVFGRRDCGGSRGLFGEDIFRDFKGNEGSGFSHAVRKGPPVERTLVCSLEDLYKGTTKKMKISRDVIDSNG